MSIPDPTPLLARDPNTSSLTSPSPSMSSSSSSDLFSSGKPITTTTTTTTTSPFTNTTTTFSNENGNGNGGVEQDRGQGWDEQGQNGQDGQGEEGLEYHRQVLKARLEAERGQKPYVSPSDTIMSPCTAKLSAYKSRHFGKAKPQSLFAKMGGNAGAGAGTAAMKTTNKKGGFENVCGEGEGGGDGMVD